MKTLIAIVCGLLLAAGTLIAAPPEASPMSMTTISGKDLLLIEAARQAVKAITDISEYSISIERTDTIYRVYFGDPDKKPGIRGSSSKLREYTVEIDKETSRVLRIIPVR